MLVLGDSSFDEVLEIYFRTFTRLRVRAAFVFLPEIALCPIAAFALRRFFTPMFGAWTKTKHA